jgi:hypothetical protein
VLSDQYHRLVCCLHVPEEFFDFGCNASYHGVFEVSRRNFLTFEIAIFASNYRKIEFDILHLILVQSFVDWCERNITHIALVKRPDKSWYRNAGSRELGMKKLVNVYGFDFGKVF